MAKPKEPLARVLFFDIESTGLVADFGSLLAVGYKWAHEKKVQVMKITDYPQWEKDHTYDRGLVRDFMALYETADIIVTYNGKRFDVPYLIAKCLEYKVPIPPNIPHVDLYQTVKHNTRISRKSLQNVGYLMSLSAEKTPVEGRIWKRASAGYKPAIKYIVDHCDSDVLLLEEAYYRLRPLVRMHPRVGRLGACRSCGSEHLQLRGRALTTTVGERQRVYCVACGSWESRPNTALGLARGTQYQVVKKGKDGVAR